MITTPAALRPSVPLAVTIRDAGAADARRLAEIDLLPDVRPWLDLPLEADDGIDSWTRNNRDWMEDPRHRCVVAVLPGGAVVGSVTLSRRPGEPDGACLALKVDPACQNRGVGGALLRWLVTTADALGLDRLYLAVLRTNRRAVALYARNGFVYDGPSSATCDRMVRMRPR